jgi:thymidylate synthase (FAD)
MVKYVKQGVEILTPREYIDDAYKMIELAGRTCYKSEDLITEDSAEKFVRMIVDWGHLSVIEHVNVTVKFITNRGMTHELVRHRLASYSQESTRYCNYSKDKHGNEISVIDQKNLMVSSLLEGHKSDYSGAHEHYVRSGCESCKMALHAVCSWEEAMENAENKYLKLIEAGASPQIARGVLPIDLKTEIVMTANLREWGHVFRMRTSKDAHPNIRALMLELFWRLESLFPGLYDDLEVF